MTVGVLLSMIPPLCHLLDPLSACRIWPALVMDGAIELALSSSLFTSPQHVSYANGNKSIYF